MASFRDSRPAHLLLGVGLVSLLSGLFYVGSTLPTSEPTPTAEEQAATVDPDALEAPGEADSTSGGDDPPRRQAEGSPRTFEPAPPEALDSLDSLGDDILEIWYGEDADRFIE